MEKTATAAKTSDSMMMTEEERKKKYKQKKVSTVEHSYNKLLYNKFLDITKQ